MKCRQEVGAKESQRIERRTEAETAKAVASSSLSRGCDTVVPHDMQFQFLRV